jgi:hypothetical protein
VGEPFTLEYGGPFTGFNSAVQRELAPPGAATGSSTDWRLEGLERRWKRRKGMANIGGLTGVLEVNSGAPDSIRMRALQAFPFHVRSADGGFGASSASDTHGVLYADDRYGTSLYAQLYFRYNPTGGDSNEVIGQRMNAATTYPIDEKIAAYTGGPRFQTVQDRAKQAIGSRRCVEFGDFIFSPCYGLNNEGVPNKWSKCVRGGGVTATKYERVMPAGHIPPLRSATSVTCPGDSVTTDTSPTNIYSQGSWQAGSMFFFAVMFGYKDGSWSLPTQVRAPNRLLPQSSSGATKVAGGYGLFTVAMSQALGFSATPGPNPRYRAIQYNGIPCGETEDCVRRALLRTPVVDGFTTAALPDVSDLRIIDIIENNTQTSYIDEHGDDTALVADPNLVRFDHILMPRARYLAPFDQRLIAANCRRNPVAVFIAPRITGAAAEASPAVAFVPNDINSTFNGGAPEGGVTAFKYYVEVTTVSIKVYRWNGLLASTPGIVTYTFALYPTIQEMVDAICLSGDTSAGLWDACLAPGADGFALCVDALAVNTALGSYTNGPYGDKFTASPTSNTVYGNLQRCYCNAWPGVLIYSTAYLAQIPDSPRGFYYTGGGPAHARNAGNSWYFGVANYGETPNEAGDIMGAAALRDGAMIFCKRGRCVLRNTKGGNTGLDEEYQVRLVAGSEGCISDLSVASVNGCAICLTEKGLIADDGQDWVNLSLAIHNAAERTGEWAYEISQCVAAKALDNLDGAKFQVSIVGSKIVVSYRTASHTTADDFADRQMEYDFSPSTAALGIASLLDDEGNVFGWSCPLTRRLSACCEVQKSDGVHHFGSYDVLSGLCGRVDEFDVGTYDVDATIDVLLVKSTNGSPRLTSVNSFRGVAVGATVPVGTSFTVGSVPQLDQVSAAGCSWADATLVVNTTGEAFSRFNVGAELSLPAALAGRTITAKSSDNNSITVSGSALTPTASAQTVVADATVVLTSNTATTATATRTFTGKAVVPVGFSRTVVPDPKFGRKHRIKNITTKYHKATVGVKVAVARLRAASRTADTYWATQYMPAVTGGEPFANKRLNAPQSARAPGQVVEVRFSDDGNDAESSIYKIVVEGEMLELAST